MPKPTLYPDEPVATLWRRDRDDWVAEPVRLIARSGRYAKVQGIWSESEPLPLGNPFWVPASDVSLEGGLPLPLEDVDGKNRMAEEIEEENQAVSKAAAQTDNVIARLQREAIDAA